MYEMRLKSVRHAVGMNTFYRLFERTLILLAPLLKWAGYHKWEKPFAAIERKVKGVLFDCQMCGQCILSSTGMSCPMNCPKSLRNGPCGGVRANGHCEVKPEMKCVWVMAWEGTKNMNSQQAILQVQPQIDHRLKGRSAWLRVLRIEHPETITPKVKT